MADVLLGKLLGTNKGTSPAAGLFKWDKRPVNDIGEQIEEGDKVKLKLFLRAPDQHGNVTIIRDPYWHAEQVGAEFDDGAYWVTSLAGPKQWDKAEVFTVKKVKNRMANEHGWGLDIVHDGKEVQVANNGHWISTYRQKLYHPVSIAAVSEGGPRLEGPYLYGLYFESNPHSILMSTPRLNVKGAGRYCIFVIMRADQPDPNPDEKMSDNLGEEPAQKAADTPKIPDPQKSTTDKLDKNPPGAPKLDGSGTKATHTPDKIDKDPPGAPKPDGSEVTAPPQDKPIDTPANSYTDQPE